MSCRTFAIALLSMTVATESCTIVSADTLRVPDDHKTIQAALDAATAGDIILVAPGTYRERIRVIDEVTLKSAGDDSMGQLGLRRAEVTIIDGGGEQGDVAGVTMAQGATIDGFTVTNVGRYDDAAWTKHHTTQGDDQLHDHIGEPGTSGISVTGVTCIVRHNIVHHIGHTGIAIQGVSGKRCSPHVEHNICYRNMGGGIGSMLKSTAIIEHNTCFQNFYAGIGHDDASPSVIGNVCYENIRAGIGISEGSCPIVRSNRCYRNRRAGIGIRAGANTRPVIEDNDCFENDMAGIGTEEEASPLIRSNRCYRNKLAGIGSQKHAAPTIVNNECYENEKTGIGQESDSVTVLIGNYCHHNQDSGIGFATCETGQSTVFKNRVIDNATVAVGINPGWTVRLSGNELSRDGGLPPIVMVFEGAQATFTDNVIRGGGVAGIRAAGEVRAEHNRFIGTSLRKAGPPNFAIWALPGSEVTMTGNTVRGWRHALHATQAAVTVTGNTVSEFHNAAFLIQESSSGANVYGNTAISIDPADKALLLSGVSGVIDNNHISRELIQPGSDVVP